MNGNLIRSIWRISFSLVIVAVFSFAGAVWSEPVKKPKMLFFYSEFCSHCGVIKKEFLPGFLKKYGDRFEFVEMNVAETAVFDSLVAIESRLNFPEKEKDYPAVYFMGTLLEGEIPVGTKLEPLVKAWIARADSFEAAERRVMEQKPVVVSPKIEEFVKPVHIAYFFKQGCKHCSRAKEIVSWLERFRPNVRVESFDIAEKRSKLLAVALGLRNGVPRDRLMGTPAFFIGNDFLIEEDVSQTMLTQLVDRHSPSGTDPFWKSIGPDELKKAEAEITETFDSIALAAIALAALGDGVNPCAFATIIFFVSYLTMLGRNRREIFIVGLSFAMAVYLTYFLIGLGFLNVVKRAANLDLLSKIIFGSAAALCMVFGVLSVGDYFKARAGKTSDMTLQLPAYLKKRIHATVREKAKSRSLVAGAVIAGFTISILEFACTGQVYLPTITYMASLKAKAIGYLLFYNALFIAPLLVVFGAVYFGASSQMVAKFMERRVGAVKLVLAGVFFVVGALLFWAVFL